MSRDRFQRIGRCLIDPTARVCTGAVVGKPFRPLIGGAADEGEADTVVGARAYIGHYAIVGAGSSIASGAILDDSTIVECEVVIGEQTLVIYRAQICNSARIGRDCVIGGFVAERVIVGDRSRVFGKIVHSQHNPLLPWDAPEAEEPSAVVAEDVFVGFDAIVAGGITIEAGSYVCAGAIITRDVPARHIAFGVNKVLPHAEWRGALGGSPFFGAAASLSETPGSPEQGG